MKTTIIGIVLAFFCMQISFAQNSAGEQQLINISKEKWEWMADKNADTLKYLFHEKAVFVHMEEPGEPNRNSILLKAVAFGIRKLIFTKFR